MTKMTKKEPRKKIADMISELQSWLPNYDHGPDSYPTLVFRILASLPGGDRLEDMGYEPIASVSWQEADQLGRMLEAIQDSGDVEDSSGRPRRRRRGLGGPPRALTQV